MLYRAVRPLLFALSPDAAHRLAFAALAPVEAFAPLAAMVRAAVAAPRDPRLTVMAMGLTFPSPVGLAAGFDKNARRPRALAAMGFGHLELGTVTAQAQAPNPRPNLFRLPADRALVNRLGFPNDGAAAVARRIAATRAAIDVPLGVSIGKSRSVPHDALDAVIADYVASFDAVRPVADFVVVNVSSPNTAGLRALQAREHAWSLLAALRERAPKSRLLVKIAPDLDEAQIEDVLAVVADVGLDGVVATNTTIARDGLRTDAARIAAVGAGGLSGAPLRERVVPIVRRVRARLGPRATVIGVGGIEQAEHARALLDAGATLVQLYTGFIYQGPGVAAQIARGLLATAAGAGVGAAAGAP